MKLTQYSDLGFRLMMYLAICTDKLVTLQEVSDRFAISKNHLVKISHELTKIGLIESVRGRNGGVRLALPPEKINVEMVLQATEEGFDLVECFNAETNHCAISEVCKLNSLFDEALEAFLGKLRKVSLADLVGDGRVIENALLPFPGGAVVKFRNLPARAKKKV
ncbi:MAG: BadM/Rrf2 family transcriptional regulator [Betaproteobacteria bacterium CG2_30_59_46]|nr:MAG: BadM/Rrf2 family transcriptional regulator [Betaproteobacteria bacterium CG2_30_59_46]